MAEKVIIQNVNVPGLTKKVDKAKYNAMRAAILNILPDQAPGLTHSEVKSKVLTELSDKLFPAGQTVGWWSKTVQLDLEAKQLIVREAGKPLRWHKTL